MDQSIFEKSFSVLYSNVYNLIITNEYQVVLELACPYLDEFGHEYPSTMYIGSNNKYTGMLVYRKAIRIFIDYIHTHKINYFWYSTGEELLRRNLYKLLAKKIEKHGFICTYRTDDYFYFSRINDSDIL